MQILALLAIGLVAGAMSGLLGIGGATVVIPALIYFFGTSQHLSQGTTLAMMVPPIGLLAAWQYWQRGDVKIGWAILLAIGFFIGGLFGAIIAEHIPDLHLRKIFGVFLLVVAVRLIFWG